MELERGSQAEREEATSVELDSSDDDSASDAILNQNGLPLDQISSVPSSRFSGEIATLRRDWEHISDVVSEHQWSEDEEDERTPFFVSESEGRLSNSVFLHDGYSDGPGGVVNDGVDGGVEDDGGENGGSGDRGLELSYYSSIELEDDGGENYDGDDRGLELSPYGSVEGVGGVGRGLELSHYGSVEDGSVEGDGDVGRAIELSYCDLDEKDNLICQLQEQLKSERAGKLHADDINKSLQQEYEQVRKRLAECEMHIDRLRLAPSANDMATRTITLVYENVNSSVAASGDVVSPPPVSGNAASSNHSPTSGGMEESQLAPSRSRTPDGGSVPPPVRPTTRQQNHGTPPAVKDTRKKDGQRRESSNLMPVGLTCPTQHPVKAVRASGSEEDVQLLHERTEDAALASDSVAPNGCTMQQQEESVAYSVEDGEEENGARERRANELVADLLSTSSLTSTSVLQLVSDMSNCGSIAGFLAEGGSDGLPFTFSQESLHHSRGSADNSEQTQGRRMMMQTSTPVMSVNKPADRQLSQTSRQPKPSRLRQPQAQYRQLTEPSPTNWRQDVDETSGVSADESSLYPGPFIYKPSRIPVRDPTHPLLDTPTTTHHMPVSQQQEMDRPTTYAHTTVRDGAFDGSTGDWESQQSGQKEGADVLDPVDGVVGAVSVRRSPSQPAMHCSDSTLSEDQSEASPNGGQVHPIHLPSHRVQKEADTMAQPRKEPAEGDGMLALQKQLAAVQEELRRLSSLQHPQAVTERKVSPSSSTLPPRGCRQRTSAATAKRSSSGNCPLPGVEQTAVEAACPPHSRQDQQLPRVTEPQPYSVASRPPEVRTAHPGVNTAHLGVPTTHPGVHTAKHDVHSTHPGVHTAHPGVKTAQSRVNTAHPGVKTAQSRVNTAHPGVHTTHPGVKAAQTRVNTAHSKVHTAQPRVHTLHIKTPEHGTSPIHTTVATHGTDPLSPVANHSPSPMYSATVHSGTAPRMVSRDTVPESPVGCVPNTGQYVVRGTAPAESLKEVVGFGGNEGKQSYQQKFGRLRHGSVQHRESVLSDQGRRASRETPSSEAVATPAKMSVHSSAGFNTEPLNKEDLVKMYHILHKAGLFGPLTKLSEDKAKATDQAVQCSVDPPLNSPKHRSGQGHGHSDSEVDRVKLHRTTLPVPRHTSTPHSKFAQEQRNLQRDCSQTFCVTPPRHKIPRRRRSGEPTDTGSCSWYSDASHSSSKASSEPVTNLKLQRRRKDIELKHLTCGDCGRLEGGCQLHLSRRCSHHANHHCCQRRARSDHPRHHSCGKCNARDCRHGNRQQRRHGHHSCRHTSSLSRKFRVEDEPSPRPNTMIVYGDTVLVSPTKLCTSSWPSRSPERPCTVIAAHQSLPTHPPRVYSESKLNEACRLAEKLKRRSRRLEWDLSMTISKNYSHSFV